MEIPGQKFWKFELLSLPENTAPVAAGDLKPEFYVAWKARKTKNHTTRVSRL